MLLSSETRTRHLCWLWSCGTDAHGAGPCSRAWPGSRTPERAPSLGRSCDAWVCDAGMCAPAHTWGTRPACAPNGPPSGWAVLQRLCVCRRRSCGPRRCLTPPHLLTGVPPRGSPPLICPLCLRPAQGRMLGPGSLVPSSPTVGATERDPKPLWRRGVERVPARPVAV